jgi:hypothetical protein
MKRLVWTAALAAVVSLSVGCSSDDKKGDPKPAENTKPDPRLKPAGSGDGGPGSKVQQNQGAVKE